MQPESKSLSIKTGIAAWPRLGRRGFTLMELLIVIGLLAALATLVLSNLTYTRTEALDGSLVQKELADIQRAFQRFAADCIPQQADYKLIAKYGLAPLIQYEGYLDENKNEAWTFTRWDNDRRRGWRGPYMEYEAEEAINIDLEGGMPDYYGQIEPKSGGWTVPLICTPYYVYDKDNWHGGYYRVIPEVAGGTNEITQLWVVFPSHEGTSDCLAPGCGKRDTSCIIDELEPYARRLILNY